MDATVLRVEELPVKRVSLGREWRDARRVPATGHTVLDLGPLPTEGVLRLGALAMGAGTEEFLLGVHVGVRRVDTLKIPRDSGWHDIRLDLSRYAVLSGPCRIDLGDATGLWLSQCEVVSAEAPLQPNVLIFLIDTLREDHLGCWGYARDTSPSIDALARDGIRFTGLVPQSSWTKPSVASLLTSTYPNIHGAEDRPDVMRPGMPTLAKALEAGGYETHAFFTNINVLPLWGFGDEFMRCVDVDSALWEKADDAVVVNAAIETIRGAAGRPWFLYVHAMGPHDPYDPPAPFDTRFARAEYAGSTEEVARQRAVDRYDGEIGYTDAQFGRFMAELKALGVYDNTLVIVLSDHGEEFWEHGGEFHGTTLYEELLGVPLVVKLPGNRMGGERRDALVEGVDVAPFVLDVLGLPEEARFQGRSFMDILKDPDLDVRMGYASLVSKALSLRAAKTTATKYIRDLVSGDERWFDLRGDRLEQHPFVSPAPWGERLARHTAHVASQGAAGFHLLITCGGDEEHEVAGEVSAEGLGAFEFRYYEWKHETEREGDTIRFSMRTKDPMDAARSRDVWHEEEAEQDSAHFIVKAEPSTPITVRLRVDGEAVTEAVSFVGAEGLNVSLGDAALNPLEILANPDAFDPAGLPRRFAIYAWYVAEANTIPVEDLDAETRDALRALGYLD